MASPGFLALIKNTVLFIFYSFFYQTNSTLSMFFSISHGALIDRIWILLRTQQLLLHFWLTETITMFVCLFSAMSLDKATSSSVEQRLHKLN